MDERLNQKFIKISHIINLEVYVEILKYLGNYNFHH